METIFFLYDFQYILDQAKDIKEYHKVLIIDKQRKNPATQERFHDFFSAIFEADNIFSPDCVAEIIRDYLTDKPTTIKAILATFEGVVEVAGALRDRFEVKGISAHLSETLRNKFLMKTQIKKNGLDCAEIAEVNSEGDLIQFGKSWGFPFVLKPRSGFGTAHTYIIKNPENIPQYASLFEKETIAWVTESFVYGEEYHCDSIIQEGNILFSSVGKYHHNAIDTITGSKMDGTIVFPASARSEIPQKIKAFNVKALQALQIKNSICHLEVFVTENKDIFFGEIGARVPGGFIGKDLQNTHGINIYQLFLDLEIGVQPLVIHKGTDKYTGHVVFPSKKGYIEEISTMDDYQNTSGLLEVMILNKKGDYITERKSILDRTGYLIAEGKSYHDVKKTLDMVYQSFKLVTR